MVVTYFSWKVAATSCGGGSLKSTIIHIFEVAEVAKNGKVKFVESVRNKKL
jgi:nicotinamide mononucleotide (NMN) deamidase PncC